MKTSDSPQISFLNVPFIYSGVLYQTRIHVENMILSMDKGIVRDLWNDVIGKTGLFTDYFDALLTPREKTAKQTLTLLWNDANIQGLGKEIQEVVNEILE